VYITETIDAFNTGMAEQTEGIRLINSGRSPPSVCSLVNLLVLDEFYVSIPRFVAESFSVASLAEN
jgi:hypothetical protein